MSTGVEIISDESGVKSGHLLEPEQVGALGWRRRKATVKGKLRRTIINWTIISYVLGYLTQELFDRFSFCTLKHGKQIVVGQCFEFVLLYHMHDCFS